jgi:CBS domain-containing protein
VAADLARPVRPVLAGFSLAEALTRMDAADLEALPVVDPDRSGFPYGVLTRAAAGRVARRARIQSASPVAPTE